MVDNIEHNYGCKIEVFTSEHNGIYTTKLHHHLLMANKQKTLPNNTNNPSFLLFSNYNNGNWIVRKKKTKNESKNKMRFYVITAIYILSYKRTHIVWHIITFDFSFVGDCYPHSDVIFHIVLLKCVSARKYCYKTPQKI